MAIAIRPIISAKIFEEAIESAALSQSEHELIDYIRYKGVFSQPSIVKELRLNPKPPVLSILCETCRKIGHHIPDHFIAIRAWSEAISEHGVRWDGDLICSTARNIEGEPLTPEARTVPYEILVVHKELFTGLG
ncbi:MULTISPECIES: hypothetical protein [Prochlorococcus]|uniref:Uncharacterized protein n=1 Tax=Prochlorococcus marinus (strain SARG / CCMP1375 / SS120) TaxID=167539 RepID=Q7VB75_PROMA|nr:MULTISPECIES: hypothetical protein [Prochlorococcus]AAQ00268.1 Predicted protein [Prochlorococcus marinus subsp. marinus str. CCMP1375]KGG14076.1 hypothetical protein EV04_0561 [Prochlorococcus marinus str. LG]KGG20756.1 hypothetical protein EV08_0960 [Prochlorococcus marinus str. SS2]KGG25157.1 hypothetical protein EV09_0051 [Prochlorococcus marinus str. SS35]KGG33291.1 hypothetical protein EV10_0498 [Prochlorococcus marinus str. SS51]